MIETAFRVAKDVMGKTSSREMHVRTLLFYFALLLYNLWVPAGHEDLALWDGRAGGRNLTIALFVMALIAANRRHLLEIRRDDHDKP